MKEAIQRVVADFQTKMDEADNLAIEAASGCSFHEVGACVGRGIAYGYAIEKLKAVIAEYDLPKGIEPTEPAQPKVEAAPLPFEPSSKELEAME